MPILRETFSEFYELFDRRVGNSAERSHGSRWKLNTTLTWIALWGVNSVLQRICRNSHRFNIEIQILVGLVMAFLRIAF
ncbi:hypothetical protein [Leptospira noguchii]|uniref:Uncharacterized protein n=1 Tax=Leptospira noguchii TaxID=28182 RepID=A0AAE9GGQ2_9LEPT|nr:hypothetical protein [Leptospira noguchii]UOG56183.1 hypothetical protein MAL03_15305 [Leptospira noguchii]